MRLTEHITMLEIASHMGTVYPVLIQDGQNLLLVDTGFPGQFDALQAAILDAGYSMDAITGIVLTHQDIDHIGNINEVKAASPNAKVYAHMAEAPYIQGDQTPVKVAQMQSAIESMTAEQRAFFSSFKAAFENRITHVDIALADGDHIGDAVSIEIVHTPGHTPGHICLYARNAALLIAGDALNVQDGKLCGPSPAHTQDMACAVSSVGALRGRALQRIVCFHGGLFSGDVDATLLEIVD